jgi:hypothetical protein
VLHGVSNNNNNNNNSKNNKCVYLHDSTLLTSCPNEQEAASSTPPPTTTTTTTLAPQSTACLPLVAPDMLLNCTALLALAVGHYQHSECAKCCDLMSQADGPSNIP